MKRRWLLSVAVLLTLVLVPVGALWWTGRPRVHVSLPTARTAPADVVLTYVRAINGRDSDACNTIGVGEGRDICVSRFTLHGPHIRNLRIEGSSAPETGRAAARSWNDTGLRAWHQVVRVRSTQAQVNFADSGEANESNSWSYELVRQNSSQPWRIYSQGSP